jgi:hypothetical protein
VIVGLTYGTGRVAHDSRLVLLPILEYLRIHWPCVEVIDTGIISQVFLTRFFGLQQYDVLLRYREVLAGTRRKLKSFIQIGQKRRGREDERDSRVTELMELLGWGTVRVSGFRKICSELTMPN